MERCVLISEIQKAYGYSKAKAEEIVFMYEKQDKYRDLCELMEARQNTPHDHTGRCIIHSNSIHHNTVSLSFNKYQEKLRLFM